MKRASFLAPLALGIGGLCLYLRTMAPSVSTIFDDSLEFQVVCPTLRIAHPPGYPLYTLLGWLFSHPPGVDPAWGVNLLSAVAGAATLVALYFLAQLFSPEAAFIAPLYLALSPIFWSQATVAEVYALHALIVASALTFIFKAIENKKFLPWAALMVGLGLAHHRTSIFLLLPLALVFFRDKTQNKNKILALFALILPLAFYFYLPLRGMKVTSLDGTYTNTFEGFLRWVTASDYGVFFKESPLARPTPLSWHLKLWLSQFGPIGIVLGLIGLSRLRSYKAILWWLTFMPFTLFAFIYRVPDPEVFFIPSFLLFSLAISEGVSLILSLRRLLLRWALLVMALLQPLFIGVKNFHKLDRSQNVEVYALGASMISSAAGNSPVVIGLLGERTLMSYFQDLYGLNPDATLIAADREEERLKAVEKALAEGRAVYLTRPLPGLPNHFRLWAQGNLIRVWDSSPPEVVPKKVVGAEIAEGLKLEGYELLILPGPPRRWPVPPVPLQIRVNLYWRTLKPFNEELKISVRFYNAEGEMLIQSDKIPVHFAYPITKWKPGELILDSYDFLLKATKGPPVKLVIIAYEPSSLAEKGRIELAVDKHP
ncbi:MAG: DUF2723 domain-containing protein [Anaerolineae bacterium]|nr:DUF2723 domain-containing protein [Anaerolineae bacterium]MDW8102095.1 DUF2723 domain-containing protein [Anaerolineae bacterium]